MKMRKGVFILFSRFDLDFLLLFLLGHFTISGIDEEEFMSLFLDLYRLSCLLVEEVPGFFDTLFAGSYELSLALSFFLPCLITGVNYR